MKKGRLSPDERSMVEEYAIRDLSAGQIALRMDRHPSTIHNVMVSSGLKPPSPRTFDHRRRNGSRVKSFSAEEDVLIEKLRVGQHTLQQISDACLERFGYRRARHTISTRLRMLAARDV